MSELVPGMKKKWFLALTAGVLLLSGCSASADRATQATDVCVDFANDESGSSVNRDGLEAINIGDALFDAEITESREVDDANATFTVTGDVTWNEDGKQHRKSLFCTVTFENGEPELPLEATLF